MKYLIACLLLTASAAGMTQDLVNDKHSAKGDFYFYWGWNLDSYNNSNIHFTGDNYDFTLYDVVANGRQSDFGYTPYFQPSKITIPQYNFRVGYFISDHYDISIGVDHMKYVMQDKQDVLIDGYISGTDDYDGIYENEDITITRDFLRYEHTDGLNYINTELRRTDQIIDASFCKISSIAGLGVGMMLPKTNATLLDYERHDDFHISGYGLDVLIGIQIKIYKAFFVQTEFKIGYINMPDIRTTSSPTDRASQQFFFTQNNIVFGARF